jgi:hypothetical protein
MLMNDCEMYNMLSGKKIAIPIAVGLFSKSDCYCYVIVRIKLK